MFLGIFWTCLIIFSCNYSLSGLHRHIQITTMVLTKYKIHETFNLQNRSNQQILTFCETWEDLVAFHSHQLQNLRTRLGKIQKSLSPLVTLIQSTEEIRSNNTEVTLFQNWHAILDNHFQFFIYSLKTFFITTSANQGLTAAALAYCYSEHYYSTSDHS